jgi:hypothetical protein
MPRRSGPDTAIDDEDHVIGGGGDPNDTLPPEPGVTLEGTSEVNPEIERRLDEGLVGDFANVGPTIHERELEREQINRETADVLATMRELEGADEIRWKISRTGDPNPGRNGYLATWTGSQISQDRIRDMFGGGKYKFLGYYTNGRYAAHKTVIIADDAPRESQGRRMNGQASESSFNLSEFLAQQEARDARRRQDEMERRRYEEEREEKRRAERMSLIAAIATPAASVLAALLGNRGPDITTLAAAMKGPDPMTLLAGLKSLMPEPQPIVPQPDAIDKAISIMEKIEAFKGNPNGETGWMDILKEAIKVAGPTAGNVISLIAQRAQAAAAQRTSGNGQPALSHQQSALPAPAADTSLPVVPEGADMNLLKAAQLVPWLKGEMQKFIPAAQKRRDPELYAALLLDELPDSEEPETLTQFIERPDWFDWLQKIEPNVTNYPQWFAQLRAHLLEYLKEGEDPRAGTQEFRGPQAPPSAPPARRASESAPAADASVAQSAAGPLEPVSLSKGGV